jgi:hypothetical protein
MGNNLQNSYFLLPQIIVEAIRTKLKIMVSPVRIRVPPLLKVLQISRKRKSLGRGAEALCQQRVNSPFSLVLQPHFGC